MRTYWRSLSQRERFFVSLGLVAALATIFYLSVIEPYYQRLGTLRAAVPAQQADLAWMKAQVKNYGRLIQNRDTKKQQQRLPLLTIVEQSATQARLSTLFFQHLHNVLHRQSLSRS